MVSLREKWLSPEDTLRAYTTVRIPALQFKAVKKPFVATCKVPIGDTEFHEMPVRY